MHVERSKAVLKTYLGYRFLEWRYAASLVEATESKWLQGPSLSKKFYDNHEVLHYHLWFSPDHFSSTNMFR